MAQSSDCEQINGRLAVASRVACGIVRAQRFGRYERARQRLQLYCALGSGEWQLELSGGIYILHETEYSSLGVLKLGINCRVA